MHSYSEEASEQRLDAPLLNQQLELYHLQCSESGLMKYENGYTEYYTRLRCSENILSIGNFCFHTMYVLCVVTHRRKKDFTFFV